MKLARLFGACALAFGYTGPAFAEPDCEDWNTREFFEVATASDVIRCLKPGAGANVRDQNGNTPLHRVGAGGELRKR